MKSILIALALVLSSSSAFAQDLPLQLLREQGDLWMSPFRIQRSDAKWLAPVGIGAAALFATDWKIRTAVQQSPGLQPPSNVVSQFGSAIPMIAAPISIWGIGKLTHNEKAIHAGLLTMDAELQTELMIETMKLVAQRQRPSNPLGHGEFLESGSSFPSGHAAATFAFASVVSREYHNKPLVVIGSYGLASAVSLSRISGLNHFPSDVLIGATLGELIGRFVVKRYTAKTR